MDELREAIDKSQALKPFKDQLLLDITPEGLRIQIVDAQNRPMFDIGSAKLKDYTVAILRELAPYLKPCPIASASPATPTPRPTRAVRNYTNWELSADRANAARRALEAAGWRRQDRARRRAVVDSVLFDKGDPLSPDQPPHQHHRHDPRGGGRARGTGARRRGGNPRGDLSNSSGDDGGNRRGSHAGNGPDIDRCGGRSSPMEG